MLGPRSLPVVALLSVSGSACGGDWVVPAGTQASGGSAGTRSICAGEEAGAGAGGEAGASGDVAIDYPRGLRVVGNKLQDAAGNAIVLVGVNRSGSEYACVKGTGFFDGDADEKSVRAMASWNMTAVRVPLNETCWLGINGLTPVFSGENYKQAILGYVSLLHKYNLIPILDLHWAAPGSSRAAELWPMPNADHSVEFWADVARTFMDDDGVVFEPYNEPFPDSNDDTEAAWQCWRDGCQESLYRRNGTTYQAVGFQAIVDGIRATGSSHVILLGGIQYSNSLSRFLEFLPVDPLGNLGAAWHVYNFNACRDESCWNGAPADVIAQVPLVATEIGQNDCKGDFIVPLMQWLDGHGSGYLAWSWNALGPCQAATDDSEGQPWPLITDYCSAQPNGGYAQAFYDQLSLP